jgi:hypothetical protein
LYLGLAPNTDFRLKAELRTFSNLREDTVTRLPVQRNNVAAVEFYISRSGLNFQRASASQVCELPDFPGAVADLFGVHSDAVQ